MADGNGAALYAFVAGRYTKAGFQYQEANE